MSRDCEEKTLREIHTYWKKDENGILGPPQEIGSSLCPNECSGNGNCSNGTCICNKDFITADCSLKKGKYPIIHLEKEEQKVLAQAWFQFFFWD